MSASCGPGRLQNTQQAIGYRRNEKRKPPAVIGVPGVADRDAAEKNGMIYRISEYFPRRF